MTKMKVVASMEKKKNLKSIYYFRLIFVLVISAVKGSIKAEYSCVSKIKQILL